MNNVLEDVDDLEDMLREEIAFWQVFIQQYKKEGESVVPSRAIEALSLAEEKLSFYQNRYGESINHKLFLH